MMHTHSSVSKKGISPPLWSPVCCRLERIIRLSQARTDGDETKGATDVYVGRNIADILEGGKIGERIITVSPGQRKFKNVLVFTDRKKVVRTAYFRTDKRLEIFLREYVD